MEKKRQQRVISYHESDEEEEERKLIASSQSDSGKGGKGKTTTTTTTKVATSSSSSSSSATAAAAASQKGKNEKKRKIQESDEEEEEEEEPEVDDDDEEDEDDDNFEEEEEEVKKKTPSKKNVKKTPSTKPTSKPAAAKSKSTTSASKGKVVQRKKRGSDVEDEDDDEDDEDDDDEGTTKKKRSRKSTSSTKSTPAKKRKVNKRGSDDEEENDDDDDDNDHDDDGDENEEDEDGDDDDNDDEEEEVIDENGETKRKKTKASSSSSSSRKPRKTSERMGSIKELTRLERIDEARKAYKWWEAEDLPNGVNWRKLEHPGILFPASYVRHNIPLLYDGVPVALTAEQEEIATFYASIPEDGPQLGNPKTRTVFQENFFTEFKGSLGTGHVIKKFDKCDFRQIREHLTLQKSLKKAATDEEKLIAKREKEAQISRYGYALIDGRIEKMGNFNMEPPGLFRGRGEHPRTGALKRRTFPESVELNLSIDSCIPKCHLPGHAWQSVKHDPLVTWLCGWNENVQQSHKYVMLAASSSFKGKSDLEKYGKAIRLASHISKIRKDYTVRIKSKDATDKQMGTAMWVIDILALRVGGEKGEDEADTVGCCSLRVEHVTFMESTSSDHPSYEIELEFLGKDSMLYKQTINFATYGDLGKLVYRNIRSFCAGKQQTDDIFDKLTPAVLNRHLNSLMKGLSAKVFRTYNASVTLEKELPKEEDLADLTLQEKIILYNAANRQVAILCNHQKTVSKAAEQMFENLNEKLETMRQQRTELLSWKDLIKKGKESKIPLKDDDTETVDQINEQLRAAQVLRDTAKTTEEKLEAATAMEAAKLAQKNDQKRRFQEKHLFKSIPSSTSLENKIARWQEDIRRLETDIRNRDENKEVALGTSKINYMDPRISVAWCKRCEVPIDKVFAKTLRDKFNWAMAVPPDWKFNPSS